MHDSLDPIKNNGEFLHYYKYAIVISNRFKPKHEADSIIFDLSADELKDVSKLQNLYNLDFINNKEKVFISLTPQIFHFITDNLQPILYHYRRDNNVQFIIDTALIQEHQSSHLDIQDVLVRFLNFLEADYFIVNSNPCDIVLDNVFYHNSFGKTEKYLFEIQEILRKCYNINNDIIPNKKIYVSRSKVDLIRKNDSRSDVRLYNSNIIEDFLIENSFSIIFFEDFSFKDRLNLLNETKLISGVSGSGLMGALFMQENQTVIEYQKMLFDGKVNDQKHLHFQYESMAYIRKHLFLCINSDPYAENLIKQIKNNKTLMSLISE